MAKSRFRYWLGMGILFGMLASFFKVSVRQNLLQSDRHAYHNGFHKHLASSNQEIESDQLSAEHEIGAFENRATSILINSSFRISTVPTRLSSPGTEVCVGKLCPRTSQPLVTRLPNLQRRLSGSRGSWTVRREPSSLT